MINMIGKTLKYYREQNDMSQKEVAEHLSITRQAYNRYETGQREPGLKYIMLLCDVFGTTPAHLLYYVNDEEMETISLLDDFYSNAILLEKKARAIKTLQLHLERRQYELDGSPIPNENSVSNDEVLLVKKDMEATYNDFNEVSKHIIEMLENVKSLEDFLTIWN